mmetsp:Transcript_25402/g.71054  ORF Transcript_25402/g.71054 Transcript_25402/m.71054 type:complete len:352 (+) Transcript_25402:94-1149(+)
MSGLMNGQPSAREEDASLGSARAGIGLTGARGLVVCGGEQHVAWGRELQATLALAAPGAQIDVWTAADDPASVVEAASKAEAVFAWEPPPGLWALCGPSLTFISSLGIGTDHLHSGGTLPSGVPVAKLVDPLALLRMGLYCLHAVLGLSLGSHAIAAQQAAGGWQAGAADLRRDPPQMTVGVMGLGPMGMSVASALTSSGFKVLGWSRRHRSSEEAGFPTYDGMDTVPEFLRQLQVLVVILPSTPETDGLLGQGLLSLLQPGAALVNTGRGQVVVEEDLLRLLDSGHLSQAILDVTAPEPPTAGSPLWSHPRVTLTPHIAGRIGHDTACQALIGNWARVRSGEPLQHQVHL